MFYIGGFNANVSDTDSLSVKVFDVNTKEFTRYIDSSNKYLNRIGIKMK